MSAKSGSARHDRGHTSSVPHKPDGDRPGRPVMAARRAAPVFPLSTGSKKDSPARDRPLREDRRPPRRPRRARLASRSGCVGARSPRSTGMPPRARASWPIDRRVEDLLLGQEAHRPAQAGRHDGQGGDVEVAAVVGRQDDRAPRRARARRRRCRSARRGTLRAARRAEQVVGLEPSDGGHPRRAGPSARPATGAAGPPRAAGDRG